MKTLGDLVPTFFVILGVTEDLTGRKLLPALRFVAGSQLAGEIRDLRGRTYPTSRYRAAPTDSVRIP